MSVTVSPSELDGGSHARASPGSGSAARSAGPRRLHDDEGRSRPCGRSAERAAQPADAGDGICHGNAYWPAASKATDGKPRPIVWFSRTPLDDEQLRYTPLLELAGSATLTGSPWNPAPGTVPQLAVCTEPVTASLGTPATVCHFNEGDEPVYDITYRVTLREFATGRILLTRDVAKKVDTDCSDWGYTAGGRLYAFLTATDLAFLRPEVEG